TERPSPTPTLVPSPSPSPSSTAVPVISWSLAAPIDCRPVDSTGTVASGGSIGYVCTVTMIVRGEVHAGMGLTSSWTLDVSASPGWSALVVDADGQPRGDGRTGVAISTPVSIGGGQVANPVTTSFGLQVVRDSCTTTSADVAIAAQGKLAGSGVSIQAPSDAVAAASLEPGLRAIPEPSIILAGPLELGVVNLSPDGSTSDTSGTIDLRISGLDQACGTWTILVTGGALSNDAGATIAAGNLTLRSVNGVPAGGGSCRLDGGCVVATVTAGPGSSPVIDLVLGIGLQVPIGTDVGSFTTTLQASIAAN
ncbi:MAG TPA: hypothetical protein VFQ54_08115, partial [Thermomicrobiales bacterium]|nr:hypothetical protein [Thermomicrobiales bacterium]